MKTFKQSKEDYIKDHLSKGLASPERRLNALFAIEEIVRKHDASILNNDNLFKSCDKESFKVQYERWKGKTLSGAEKSVINGLFKFAQDEGNPNG